MTFLQKCLSITLILFTMTMHAFAATQATASVSNNQVYLGDIFMLNVEVDDTGSEYQLDTDVLKDKFTVFLPSRGQKQMYINGEFKAQTTWQVRLQANKIGTFTIPSLKIGDVQTQAIKIQVIEPSAQQKSVQGDAIFIENSLNKSKIYLGQQVILDTKIYVSENISNADVLPPALDSVDVERIDPKPQSQIIRNGIRYQVFSYQYKITPSIAKEMVIPSPLLTGQMNRRVNQWQGQSAYQAINIRGNTVALTVKDIPSNFQGDWLVSDDVRIIENNDLHSKEYAVGDPITRSISLQVASISLDKMPQIKLNYNNSMRYYPDKDDLKQGEINNKLYTQRTITHAIIANKAGQLVLPEIKIPWWNSVTDKQEFATLPAQTLTIKAAPSTNNNQSNSTPLLGNAALDQAKLNTSNNQPVNNTAELLFWKISTLVLFLLLVIGTIYHFTQRKGMTIKDNNSVNNVVESKQPYKALLIALQHAQPQLVYNSLLRYLQSKYPAITQIQEIENYSRLNEEKKQQLLLNLKQLELACSGQTHQWNAGELTKLIKQEHQLRNRDELNPLSDINP
ncbi:BatD family protein [Psychromonas algicola]|uniref:BatD family protein n=1 Tax=Psychromonas algicola TaxID=2555642 RepID=UPI001068C486|nr:BatD family protein [Psychromonas sp. RZ5]TEW52574.1 protein BatD [Psychromonas sp. RZ5]